MTESKMGEGWTLYGNEEVRDLQRRAVAVLRAIELLDALHSDAIWGVCCTVAGCIEELVRGLGWRHAGLVNHMLCIPDPYDDAEMDAAAQGLAGGCKVRVNVHLPDGVEFLGSMDLAGLRALVSRASAHKHGDAPVAA